MKKWLYSVLHTQSLGVAWREIKFLWWPVQYETFLSELAKLENLANASCFLHPLFGLCILQYCSVVTYPIVAKSTRRLRPDEWLKKYIASIRFSVLCKQYANIDQSTFRQIWGNLKLVLIRDGLRFFILVSLSCILVCMVPLIIGNSLSHR